MSAILSPPPYDFVAAVTTQFQLLEISCVSVGIYSALHMRQMIPVLRHDLFGLESNVMGSCMPGGCQQSSEIHTCSRYMGNLPQLILVREGKLSGIHVNPSVNHPWSDFMCFGGNLGNDLSWRRKDDCWISH